MRAFLFGIRQHGCSSRSAFDNAVRSGIDCFYRHIVSYLNHTFQSEPDHRKWSKSRQGERRVRGAFFEDKAETTNKGRIMNAADRIEMQYPCFIAADLGASSGRVIAAQLCEGSLRLREVSRFSIAFTKDQHSRYLCWGIDDI